MLAAGVGAMNVRVSVEDVSIDGATAPTFADWSALAGAVAWMAIVVADLLGPIQDVIAVAVLVLVPLGLRLVDVPASAEYQRLLHRAATLGQPPAAVATVAALALPQGLPAVALSVPWILLTSAVAGIGALRFLDRRALVPLHELAIDAGLLYLPVASGALVFDRLGVSLFFAPVIITLTVVHFHYAGFVLPLVAGFAGRVGADGIPGLLLRSSLAIIVVGPGIIAVGITFSPIVEVIAVSFFTATVAVFGLAEIVGVLPRRSSWPQRLLLAAGAIALPVSMAYAVLYGYGAFTGTTYVTIGEMVATHGRLNAFGFALLTLLGWRLAPVDAPEA